MKVAHCHFNNSSNHFRLVLFRYKGGTLENIVFDVFFEIRNGGITKTSAYPIGLWFALWSQVQWTREFECDEKL